MIARNAHHSCRIHLALTSVKVGMPAMGDMTSALRLSVLLLPELWEEDHMRKISISTPGFVRSACLAAAAVLALSITPVERVAAMTPISPGIAPSTQSATDDLMIQVRGGGGGGHGGPRSERDTSGIQ